MQIAKLALISVSSAYSTKAEPKRRHFCGCPCLQVPCWLWRLICWAFGETGRKAAFYCRFLFVPSLFPLFFSLSLPVSAHGLQCRASGSSGSGSISAALVVLVVCWRSCLRCCCRAGSGSSGVSASGLDLWAALPLVLSPCLSPSVSALGLVLRPLWCCLGVSRRSRVQCCGSGGAGAGRRCRPKGYGIMHNSVRLYLYDVLIAYCTKRCCF